VNLGLLTLQEGRQLVALHVQLSMAVASISLMTDVKFW